MESEIVSYAKIADNKILQNKICLFEDDKANAVSVFLHNAYKHIGLAYPKFFKMDNLCKSGIIATEIAVTGHDALKSADPQHVALLFANNSSSIETDRAHVAAISDKKNYFPSPSTFVYTLANIVTGEIAIKYKITGENGFFVMEKFDPAILEIYSNILLADHNTTMVICGWVNADINKHEAFVYCVKKSNFKEKTVRLSLPHTTQNILELYNLK